MFNKKDYVNNYIKENYKTYKLRIKKDNDLILEKLGSVDNVNKYLTDLIMEDIKKNEKFRFINNNIKIDFKVTPIMQDLMDNAEEADRANDDGKYYAYADAIDVEAKNDVRRGKLTEEQWVTLVRRYVL